MSNLLLFFPVVITLISIVSFNGVLAQHDGQEKETLSGFVLYNVDNGKIKYLLLKKANGHDDWGFPLGKQRTGVEAESVMNSAIRETLEKTGLVQNNDYQAQLGNEMYFEFTSQSGVHTQLHLWPAEVQKESRNLVELSPEFSQFTWLEYDEAVSRVKRQEYKVGLTQADTMIRALKTLPTLRKYKKRVPVTHRN